MSKQKRGKIRTILTAIQKAITPKRSIKSPKAKKLAGALTDVATSLASGRALTVDDSKTIREGMEEKKKVSFNYTRKDGVSGKYVDIEPYEVKEGDFWGFHDVHGSIHRFKLDRMEEVDETEEDFKPRDWDKENK